MATSLTTFQTGRHKATDATEPLIERHTISFVATMLFCCLFLQRFGLPLGGKSFSIVGPIGLSLAAFGMLRGVLAFHRLRLTLYCAFCLLVALGIAWHAAQPRTALNAFAGAVNFDSLAQFLPLTLFATVTFSMPLGERRFFHEVNRWFSMIAIAGILQFLAQFAGFPIFAFSGFLPEAILFEQGYNQQIMLGVGDLLKSNGFFLAEPSTFSQLMAVAFTIELVGFRRARFLALFITGLLLSFSGTGWIVLETFLLALMASRGRQGLALGAATIVVLAALLGALAWLAPDVAASLQGRFDELSLPGTSGHDRFITPFWVLHDVLQADPSALAIGIGSGVSERLQLPYGYDVNTPVKVLLEYGLPALLVYLALFVASIRPRVQSALVLPVMVMFLFTGGYQQFPPMLFLVLLLITVSRLVPDSAVPAPSAISAKSAR